MTTISRFMGLARDIIFAHVFGANAGTDAFFVAFKIPNFLRRLFAEGAFAQSFVPVFSEYKETRSRTALVDLIDHVAGSLGGVLLLITTICMAATPLVVMIFAPGFIDDADRFALTTEMLRITFPYIFFISLVAFSGGILNSFNQFAVPAFTPVFLNICLIGAALWASPYFEQPVIALAWGVALAGFTQLAFQIPFLIRLGLMPRPRLKRDHEGVKKISKLMIPAIIGSSVAQINLLLDTVIASFLMAGSVSWLYFSDRLVEFPLGVFGIALATVILPNLSKQHANKSADEYNHTIDWALRLVMLIAVPCALGLLMLSQPILATLFQYGEFNTQDSYMSSLSLMAYSLGLPAFILIKALVPAFYARQDTKTPMKIAVKAMTANMGLNILFVVPMVYYSYEAPHVGLALATSASAYMNAGLLFFALKRQGIYQPQVGWGKLGLQLIVANALLAGFIFYWTPGLDVWTNWSLLDSITNSIIVILLAAIIYFCILFLSGFRPALLNR